MSAARMTLEGSRRWQWGSLVAGVTGLVLVAVVQTADGGTLPSLLQVPAALIVFGGTCAATLVTYSPAAIRASMAAARDAFRGDDENFEELSTYLVALAIRVYRGGPLVLEGQLDSVRDSFLRNGLTLVIDGVPMRVLRDALRAERLAVEAREDLPARVFETAAGYAPTLGILGAVLGLMRVMDHLASPSALGAGVATAFVATVYGVGSANLILLPIAARLRERAAARARRRDLISETLFDLQRRLNPRMVAHKTRGFVTTPPRVEDIARLVAATSSNVHASAKGDSPH